MGANGTVAPLVQGNPNSLLRVSDELIEALRQRVADKYYDQPEVIRILARVILHSRGIYTT